MKSSSKTHKIVYTIAVEVPYEEDLLQYNAKSTEKIKSVINSLKHVSCAVNTGLWEAKIGYPTVPINREGDNEKIS